MRVIIGPSVYLVGSNQIEPGWGEFCDGQGGGWRSDAASGAQALCETAGRVCYLSFKSPRPGGNAAYLKHIIESSHGSVLEHAVFSLILTGVSRSLTHELIRHRQLSYSELSQRYVDCSDVAFVVPPALLAAVPAYLAGDASDHRRWDMGREWYESCRDDLDSYHRLADSLLADAPAELAGTDRRKWARQAARSVLPNCAETKVFVTGNARAWRNVIEQRTSRHADAEIRRLFDAVHAVLVGQAPALFTDYDKVPLPDGTWELVTANRKV